VKFTTTALPEVLLIEPDLFSDDRGWLAVQFDGARFNAALQDLGLPAARPFVQEIQSMSQAGVLRGLHYQLPPHAQGKLVRVLRGAAFDVAVDLRRASPSFGRWVGTLLSAENRRQTWIPEGFAHGFLALADDTQLLYRSTDVYAPQCERCLLWNDPALGIEWPVLAWGVPRPNARDAAAPRLSDAALF
jgi:dTDP-4-dehydrorhamnose 3,5-epimerase